MPPCTTRSLTISSRQKNAALLLIDYQPHNFGQGAPGQGGDAGMAAITALRARNERWFKVELDDFRAELG